MNFLWHGRLARVLHLQNTGETPVPREPFRFPRTKDSMSSGPVDPQQELAYEPPSPERVSSVSPTEMVLEYEAIPPAHDPYAAWREPDFRLYAAGWTWALVGQQIQNTAIGWEIYQRTGSRMDLGWIGLVQAIPVMLLALPAGHVADRYDRRKVVMAGQAIAVLCSIALGFISWALAKGQISYAWMYLPLLISSAGFTFGRAARYAMLPGLVPTKIFSNAITWNSSIFETSGWVGPMIGGIVIARGTSASGSFWFAYLLAVIGQTLYLIFLAMMRSRPVIATPKVRRDEGLAAGIRFVWGTKIIFGTITLDLFAVLLGGATYLLPAYAQILHVGPVGFGWLKAAPALRGSLDGIFTCPPKADAEGRRKPALGRRRLWRRYDYLRVV